MLFVLICMFLFSYVDSELAVYFLCHTCTIIRESKQIANKQLRTSLKDVAADVAVELISKRGQSWECHFR